MYFSMKIFRQNIAARAVKTLSLGVLSVWLLSCEKSTVEPAEEAKPLSSGSSETSSGELNPSVLYFFNGINLFKITGANSDAPKKPELIGPTKSIGNSLVTMDKSKDQLYFISGQQNQLMRVNTDGSGLVILAELTNPVLWRQSLRCDGKNLYWVEVPTDILVYTAHIIKADLSGQNRKIIYKGRPTILSEPLDGKIYFQDRLYNAVCSIDTNGFFLKVVTKNTLITETGTDQLCVNAATKKMYWLRYDGLFCSANLDGTDYKLIKAGPNYGKTTTLMEVDPSGKFLYYTDRYPGLDMYKIIRLDLENLTKKVLVDPVSDGMNGMIVK